MFLILSAGSWHPTVSRDNSFFRAQHTVRWWLLSEIILMQCNASWKSNKTCTPTIPPGSEMSAREESGGERSKKQKSDTCRWLLIDRYKRQWRAASTKAAEINWQFSFSASFFFSLLSFIPDSAEFSHWNDVHQCDVVGGWSFRIYTFCMMTTTTRTVTTPCTRFKTQCSTRNYSITVF